MVGTLFYLVLFDRLLNGVQMLQNLSPSF